MSVFGVFLVRIRENMDQKNSEYGDFSRSAVFDCNDFPAQFHFNTFLLQSCSGKKKLISLEPRTQSWSGHYSSKKLFKFCLKKIKNHFSDLRYSFVVRLEKSERCYQKMISVILSFWLGLSEPIFKVCGSCSFGINIGFLKKEAITIGNLM